MRCRWTATALGLMLLGGAGVAVARDCGVPAEATACATNADCGCGTALVGGACAAQVDECLTGAGDCYDFCAGRFVALAAVCRDGSCRRTGASACAGDCDADAAVGIDELMIAVGVALDLHPLAACANLDLDRDGAAGVPELVRAVRAALDGCAAAAPRLPGLRGAYDAELTTRGVTATAAATVSEEEGGVLAISIAEGPNQSIDLHGPVTGDHVVLMGYYLVTDIAYEVEGEATIAVVDGVEVISGTIESASAGSDLPDHFVLRHRPGADVSHFSGVHEIRFDESPRGNGQASGTALRFDVAPDGYALTGEGEDRGGDGALYGTLTTGSCRVTAGGNLSCRMGYLLADSELSTPLTITGNLERGGEFLSGVDPPFGPEPYVHGHWR